MATFHNNAEPDMTRILMVRHGHAAASYTDDTDPGLDDPGRAQARSAAELIASRMPLAILSSPLKRARETAAPLLEAHGGDLVIENRVSEIPSPGMALSERGPWLRGVMQGRWSEQSEDLQAWRMDLVDCLKGQTTDCVIFSHYVAINVAAGYAEGKDEVLVFQPGYTSITEFETDGDSLVLVRRGDQAETKVN